jgi:hypothetical protein
MHNNAAGGEVGWAYAITVVDVNEPGSQDIPVWTSISYESVVWRFFIAEGQYGPEWEFWCWGGECPLGCNRTRALRRFLLLRRLVQVVGVTGNSSSRRYRPEGQEMENDSESEEENADDPIQVSWSVAQRRLALLASGRKTMPTMANTTTVVANPVMMNVKTNTDDDVDLTPRAHLQQQPPRLPVLQKIATVPIPLGHPYKLPAPVSTITPRTTRRQMLQTELSESLRRNRLGEREVSNLGMRGGRGGAGVGGARRQSSSALLGVQ